MNRIDRLVAILIHLQSRRIVTAGEIAERFEVSIRTTYRDIRALEEAGVPILSEPGKGYSIMEGYRLPPVMFTHQEATALLTASKLVEKLTDNSLKNNYESALYKIKSVLKDHEQDYLEKLEKHISVMDAPSWFPQHSQNNYLSEIQQAIVSRKVLCLEYYSNHRNELTSRFAEPIGICFYSQRWHVIAFCRSRNEYRDFRIDRIKQLRVLDETFTNQHPDFNSYSPLPNNLENMQPVVVRFSKPLALELTEAKYYFGYFSEKTAGNFIEMTFLTNSFDWFGGWLLGFGNKIEIISPPSLLQFMKEKSIELSHHYATEKKSESAPGA